MFKGLIRKLSGIKGYKELLTKSVAIVKTYADTDDSVLGFLARNEEYLIGWIDYIAPHLVEISNVDSKQQQILKLRKKTVEAIEASYRNKQLIDNERSEQEKEIIVKELSEGSNFEEYMALSAQLYIYANASSVCYRSISMELGDASKNDWFPMYCDLYNQFITQLYNQMIAQEQNEVNVLEAMLPAIKQVLDETKGRILQGYHWNYENEDIEQEDGV